MMERAIYNGRSVLGFSGLSAVIQCFETARLQVCWYFVGGGRNFKPFMFCFLTGDGVVFCFDHHLGYCI